MSNLVKRGYKVLSCIPFFYSILFFTYVLIVSLKIGYIPSFNNPDPITMGIDKFYLLLLYSYDYVFLAAIFWLLFTFVFIKNQYLKVAKPFYFIGFTGSIYFLLSAFFDPFGLELWFFD